VVLACHGRVVAAFGFEEFVREGAPQAIQALESAGLQLTLLSGDAPVRAQALAHRLGLTDCRAGLLPEDKLGMLRQAQSEGRRAAMVGDGLNDAPVLAAADVSVAMGHGALAAREGADAVIVSGRLDALADLRAHDVDFLTLGQYLQPGEKCDVCGATDPRPKPAEESQCVGPLRRGVNGVCTRSTCECEREGLGDRCIWLRPSDAEVTK
jgi:soluble P-type ATPase